MLGYFRDPQQTRKTLKDGWVDTGDCGYTDQDGFVYFVDRTKDIIRRSGENISSREIEDVLNAHPNIEASAVIPVPDPIRVEEVKAYVIPKGGSPVSPQEIIAFCSERLADFKIPRYIEFRQDLPRSGDLKIQKRALKEEEPYLTSECYDRLKAGKAEGPE
jgi:acyl-CoA synthetase (AMP-forming)/AMP-acid ligase II